MKVLQGIWLSNNAERNRRQIATVVALAKKYPDVISRHRRRQRSAVARRNVGHRPARHDPRSEVAGAQPVTYADVWEFWLRYSDLQNAVDFVTIHILPYWEDFPLPASLAAAHVDAIRKRVAAAIPNKEIVIGEFGWPSAGPHARRRRGRRRRTRRG